MLRSLIAVIVFSVTATAGASDMTNLMRTLSQQVITTSVGEGLNMNVGDTASFNLSIAQFIKGTMSMTVKSVAATAIVIDQNMSLSVGNMNQDCEETIDPTTGQISNMVCNGQAQNQQAPSNVTVVDEKEATITVAAGTFDCLYIKATEGAKNQTVEQWLAPKQVPVFGLVKSVTPFLIGTMSMELASYKRF